MGKIAVGGARRVGSDVSPRAAWLTEPEVFEVAREPAHSDFRKLSGIAGVAEPRDLSQRLSVGWRVRVVPALAYDVEGPGGPLGGFMHAGFDDSSFDCVEVPSNLEMTGHLRPQYVNIQYPWDGHEDISAPDVPAGGHVALYRCTFKPEGDLLRAVKAGFEATITFEGAATAVYVWLNGKFLGYAEDSCTPSEFDTSGALSTDRNILAVACYEHSSASWLEDQDFWRLHGIFRDVIVRAHPACRVRDLRVEAGWDIKASRGALIADIELACPEHAARVVAAVEDSLGVVLWAGEAEPSGTVTLTDAVPWVEPWSAETPVLYTLRVSVIGREGALVDEASTRVGFRTVAIDNGVLRLNGERIILRGVNRHEFDDRRGRAVTEQDMLWDVRFLKRHNVNAVRTSHYPNQQRWYELCDEYGVYVIDEANLETHGSWQGPGDVPVGGSIPGDDERWLGACLDRVESMVARDRNHPCIIAWSLGNESYVGSVIRAMGVRVRKLDGSRPIHYEGSSWNTSYDDVSDFHSRMYTKPDTIRRWLETQEGLDARPFLSCEYSHAMGNSCGNLSEYLELEGFERYAGGFIWDFIDQSPVMSLPDGSERHAIGGDWGDRPSDYEFCGNGIVFADRTPSPKAQEVKALYSGVKLVPDETGVTISNGLSFLSTDRYAFMARMLRNGVECWVSRFSTGVRPGEERHVDVDWPLPAGGPGEVVHEVSMTLASDEPWARAGFEVAFGQRTIGSLAPPDIEDPTPVVPSRRVVTPWNVGVRNEREEVLLSRTQGGIVSWKRGDTEMVARTPSILTFRPLTDNDRGNGSGFDRAAWFAAGRYARCVACEVEERARFVAVSYRYFLADGFSTPVTVGYVVRDGLEVRLSAEYLGSDQGATLPAFGLELELPCALSRLRWYGLGPEETYRDRKAGGRVGIWSLKATEGAAPYLMAQETGNHEDVRWLEVTDAKGHGLRVERASGELACSLLPWDTYSIEAARRWDDLGKPSATFLRLFAGQMGVGGDDTWGAPVHEGYQMDAKSSWKLDVTMRSI